MPTYQYVCTQCATPLEAVQSFSDAALTECPSCGGALRKVFSAVGVVFKGSGFYKNDSRSSGKSATATGDAKPSTGSGKDGSAKTESAPAAKTESAKPAAAASTSTSSSSST